MLAQTSVQSGIFTTPTAVGDVATLTPSLDPCYSSYWLASPREALFTGFRILFMNSPSKPKPGSKPREPVLIYVVDDEPMLLELATVVLQPLGYQVKTFRDPDNAVKAFSSAPQPPALVITDYAMHTMNGLDLIAACRQLRPGQKILMVSGTVDEAIYRKVPAKPDRFLAKPYQAKQLIAAVKALISDKAL